MGILNGGPRWQRPAAQRAALIRTLSDRLVEAQRPIRILDAVKWTDVVEQQFLAARGRELPCITPDSYRPLPFATELKRAEFAEIESEVGRLLGPADPAGRILTRMCREYRAAIDMLEHRGSRRFGELSQQLYGSATETIGEGDVTLLDVARHLPAQFARQHAASDEQPEIGARQAVGILADRLRTYFQEPGRVRVRLSDGIVADAAAGCDYIKLRGDAIFTERDLRVLEVHEGWVHLGTTLNGQAQPVCTFLGKGPPSSTITQEGLAVLVELVTQAAHPARLRRVANRVEAVALAEAGADFRVVYRFFLERGCPERESYQQTMRVFRGGLPADGLPFTKDICYLKGLLLVWRHIRSALRRGDTAGAAMLFCGKATVGDAATLAELLDEGLVARPRFVPSQFGQPQQWTPAEPSLVLRPFMACGLV
ncbi:MAG: flavohemoglobin expression-modulating QEGLA motif protein [Planctomycetia bacterium]|nr:flavohemoglobin expression-modulating QEGLA motif protein [Planctomycetia bacterium]